MSGGVLLYTDASGRVCGGHDVPSEQRFDLVIKALPNIPLDPSDIAWPNGERWTVDDHHYTQQEAPNA